MDLLVLAIRVILSGVFLLAGVGKLLDVKGSVQSLAEFGVPQQGARSLAVFLPIIEISAAILVFLPYRFTVKAGSVICLVLLIVFTAYICANLIRGRTPRCHCFGQLHSAPISTLTLARNIGLGILTLILVWRVFANDPGVDQFQEISELTVRQTTIGLAAAIGIVMIFGTAALSIYTLASMGNLLTRIERLESGFSPRREGLPVDAPAPGFTASSLDRGEVTLSQLLDRGKPLVLIFSDVGCQPCRDMMPSVSRWQQQFADTTTIAILSAGTLEENLSKSSEFDIRDVLISDAQVLRNYRVEGTPSAVAVDVGGKISSPLASGALEIERLITESE